MKKYAFFLVLLASLLIAVSGCSLFSGGGSSDADNGGGVNPAYDDMLKQVQTEYKDLDSLGGAWAFTGELIGKAEEAAKGKDFEGAMKFLKDADAQTKLARAQMEQQKSAGPTLF